MRRLLIAEDEEPLRRELTLTVPWEDWGFAVVGAAEDGLQARAMLRERAPELVLCDIKMPGVEGVELLQETRATPELASTLFIFISGHAEFSYARDALRLGAVDYLVKPVDDEALRRAVAVALARLDERDAAASSSTNARLGLGALGAAAGDGRYDGQVQAACLDIADRLSTDITLDSVGSRLGLSGDHLSKLFKKATGLSFAEYLTAARMRRAVELLADPSVRIGDVADLCGYADQRYFSTVFKKRVGESPSEYRRRRQGR